MSVYKRKHADNCCNVLWDTATYFSNKLTSITVKQRRRLRRCKCKDAWWRGSGVAGCLVCTQTNCFLLVFFIIIIYNYYNFCMCVCVYMFSAHPLRYQELLSIVSLAQHWKLKQKWRNYTAVRGIPLINVMPVSCWELVLGRWCSNRYRDAGEKEKGERQKKEQRAKRCYKM